MKKMFVLFLAIAMTFALAACSNGNTTPTVTAAPSDIPAITEAPLDLPTEAPLATDAPLTTDAPLDLATETPSTSGTPAISN